MSIETLPWAQVLPMVVHVRWRFTLATQRRIPQARRV
jgi:hypothetical protein